MRTSRARRFRDSILVGLLAGVAAFAPACSSSSTSNLSFDDGGKTDAKPKLDGGKADAKKTDGAAHDGAADGQTESGRSEGGPDGAADATTDGRDAVSDAPDGSDGSTLPPLCTTTAPKATRGSAIAITPDDSRLVVVNRDVGTASVMSVTYDTANLPVLTLVSELAVGNEPWQVVIDACGANAYVVLRKDQKVVAINNLSSDHPTVGASASVGSEPTSLALTPNNTLLYVSDWVDGTVHAITPQTMKVTATIDLNAPLAATGLLGPDVAMSPRPALAHPRGIAITNNGDPNDADEKVYVTEWYAARTAPESLTPAPTAATAAVSDTNWKGLLYTFPVMAVPAVDAGTDGGSTPAVDAGPLVVSTVDLPPVARTGFPDSNGNATGCFPNQVGAITINSGYAYVTSTCASPAGPTGVFQKGQCAIDAECITSNGSTANAGPGSCVDGACQGSCSADSDCGLPAVGGACQSGGVCKPLASNAKTTTHPAVSIVNLSNGTAVTSTLDTVLSSASSTRMPLLPVDADFTTTTAYIVAEGADAVFPLTASGSGVVANGSGASAFIDTQTTADPSIQLPIGMALSKTEPFAFVANDGSRTVAAIDLTAKAVAVGTSGTDFRVLASTAAPTGAALSVNNGKRAFTTGLGRWSLNGAAWGSCAACHVDGLSDNVTWYFSRGPRQTVSLDGTFNSTDPTDQRILNWSAMFDEVADFESNVRGISGGVGAIVQATSTPPVVADRVDLFSLYPNQQGLEGSSTDIANPASTTSGHSVLASLNWADIQSYTATIRSPRGATGLVSSDVAAGQTLFTGAGNCVGCHSGAKWTISKVFYTPNDTQNDPFPGTTTSSLSSTSWASGLNGFPMALYPSFAATGAEDMRSGAPPTLEQLQCALRPVMTIEQNGPTPTGVSPADVNVLEVRQNMATGAQGAGGTSTDDFTFGYNPPSLLSLPVGAPYFHAGNARTLEELFTGGGAAPSIFAGHHASALASTFNPTATQIRQLVAYLLSIDETTAPVAVPALSATGGVICRYP